MTDGLANFIVIELFPSKKGEQKRIEKKCLDSNGSMLVQEIGFFFVTVFYF